MSSANVKFAKKRLEILRTAAAAFRHHGYYGASVADIARALHMRKGNLYYYFQNKEEILYFCHDYSLDLLLRVLREVESSDAPPEKKLHRLIVAFVHIVLDELNGTGLTLDLVALSPPRLKKIIAKRDRFDRGVRRIVKSGMDAGVFLPRDPKLLTFAIFGVVNWIPRWFNPQGPANSAEISQTFAHYLLAGLMNAAPSGEQPSVAAHVQLTKPILSS